MLKRKFGKDDNYIIFQISNITLDDFEIEGDFYNLNSSYSIQNILINYRICLNESILKSKTKITSSKKYFTVSHSRNGNINIYLRALINKYQVDSKGARFCHYCASGNEYKVSFKLIEMEEGAFDFQQPKSEKPKKKSKRKLKNNAKKRKMTVKEAQVKWSINHPFQGGGFSPR